MNNTVLSVLIQYQHEFSIFDQKLPNDDVQSWITLLNRMHIICKWAYESSRDLIIKFILE